MKTLKKILETRNIKVPVTTRLKLELEREDYKIIKCMEYQLAGKELPYDIFELNAKRDDIRKEINEKKENLDEGIEG